MPAFYSRVLLLLVCAFFFISGINGQTYKLTQQYNGFYQFSSVSIVDFNSDGNFDLFYSGNGPDPEGQNSISGGTPNGNSVLVLRDSSGLPTNAVLSNTISNTLTQLACGKGIWADFDGDSDSDLLLVGADEDRNPVLEIYLNQNGASLELSNLVDADFWTSANRIELDHNCGNAAVFDLDKDGDLDIIVAGAGATRMIRNDGGNFVVETNNTISLTGLYNAAIAPADYDNDGDMDFLICGATERVLTTLGDQKIYGTAQAYIALVRNDGSLSFSLTSGVLPASLPGLFYASADWADYTQDGALDLAIIGQVDRSAAVNASQRITYILRNTPGTYTFTDSTYAELYYAPQIAKGTVKWADVNNDNHTDLVLTGCSPNNWASGSVFLNLATTNYFYETAAQLPLAWLQCEGDLAIRCDAEITAIGRLQAPQTFISTKTPNNTCSATKNTALSLPLPGTFKTDVYVDRNFYTGVYDGCVSIEGELWVHLQFRPALVTETIDLFHSRQGCLTYSVSKLVVVKDFDRTDCDQVRYDVSATSSLLQLQVQSYRKCPSKLKIIAYILPVVLVVFILLLVGLFIFYWFWLRPEYAEEANREMQILAK